MKNLKIKILGFKTILALVFVLCVSQLIGAAEVKHNSIDLLSDNIEITKEWKAFKTFAGIKIEYKYVDCNTENVYNQTLVLFRFTNQTDQQLTLSWATEIWRDGKCRNCDEIDSPEHNFELKFKPNEIITGDCSRSNKALYVFANFIKLAPGMSDQQLTDIKFVNLQTSVWK
ncbi:MAG: hypothetical protein WDZ35_02485 [Crocinitomicaceae bacterium]